MKRVFLSVLTLFALVLLPAVPASAHAALVRTDPPASSIVEQAPRQVTLVFSESVEAVPGQLRIIGPDGNRADRGEPVTSGAQVTLTMRDQAPRGTYLVSYRIVSADSHPISGGFSFSVGAPSATVPAVSGGTGAAIDPAVAVAMPVFRYLGYLGLSALVGSLLFLFTLWPRRIARPKRLVWAGVGAVAVSTVAGFYLQAPHVTGGTLFGVSGADLREVLSSRYGACALVRLAALLVAVPFLRRILAGTTARVDQVLVSVLGAVALLTWPLSGHPSASPAPPLTVGVDGIHLAAMAVWLGGLTVLALYVLPKAGRTELDALLPVWSRWAGWAVSALVVAGVAQALIEVETLPALVKTRYGVLLLVKAGLLAGVLFAASLARKRVLGGATTGLRRLVGIEIGVIAVVLAVSALLVQTTPARTAIGAPSAADQPFSATLTSKYYKLQLEVSPARAGNNTVHMYAFTPDGQPISIPEWQLTVALPAAGIAPIDVPVLRITGDHATAETTLPTAGDWEFRATLRVSDLDQATVALTITIK